MTDALFSLEHVVIVSLWLGWGCALAGAIIRSAGIAGASQRLAAMAGGLHTLALGLIGVGLLLAGISGPGTWVRSPLSSVLGVAGASLLLLVGLVLHPSGALMRHRVFDLVLAWLAAGAGMWGCVLSVSAISSVSAL